MISGFRKQDDEWGGVGRGGTCWIGRMCSWTSHCGGDWHKVGDDDGDGDFYYRLLNCAVRSDIPVH